MHIHIHMHVLAHIRVCMCVCIPKCTHGRADRYKTEPPRRIVRVQVHHLQRSGGSRGLATLRDMLCHALCSAGVGSPGHSKRCKGRARELGS